MTSSERHVEAKPDRFEARRSPTPRHRDCSIRLPLNTFIKNQPFSAAC
jgi:hypothetical protein